MSSSKKEGSQKRKSSTPKKYKPNNGIVNPKPPTQNVGGFSFQKAIVDSYNVELKASERLPVEFSRDLLLRFAFPNSPRLLIDLNRSSIEMQIEVLTETGEPPPMGEGLEFTCLTEPGCNILRYVCVCT